MKNKFTLGAIAGISSIALAIPILAQISSAQGTPSSTATTTASTTSKTDMFMHRQKTPLTVPQIQSMIDRESAMMTNMDAFVAIQKSAMQTHKTALTAALSITDDTQRQAAVVAADQAMHKAITDAIAANPALKSGMGGGMMMGGREHGGPDMMNKAAFATKLGMTEAELKAAIDGGKTIEQIAKEKGITLPTRPAFMKHMKGQMKIGQ